MKISSIFKVGFLMWNFARMLLNCKAGGLSKPKSSVQNVMEIAREQRRQFGDNINYLNTTPKLTQFSTYIQPDSFPRCVEWASFLVSWSDHPLEGQCLHFAPHKAVQNSKMKWPERNSPLLCLNLSPIHYLSLCLFQLTLATKIYEALSNFNPSDKYLKIDERKL